MQMTECSGRHLYMSMSVCQCTKPCMHKQPQLSTMWGQEGDGDDLAAAQQPRCCKATQHMASQLEIHPREVDPSDGRRRSQHTF